MKNKRNDTNAQLTDSVAISIAKTLHQKQSIGLTFKQVIVIIKIDFFL